MVRHDVASATYNDCLWKAKGVGTLGHDPVVAADSKETSTSYGSSLWGLFCCSKTKMKKAQCVSDVAIRTDEATYIDTYL